MTTGVRQSILAALGGGVVLGGPAIRHRVGLERLPSAQLVAELRALSRAGLITRELGGWRLRTAAERRADQQAAQQATQRSEREQATRRTRELRAAALQAITGGERSVRQVSEALEISRAKATELLSGLEEDQLAAQQEGLWRALSRQETRERRAQVDQQEQERIHEGELMVVLSAVTRAGDPVDAQTLSMTLQPLPRPQPVRGASWRPEQTRRQRRHGYTARRVADLLHELEFRGLVEFRVNGYVPAGRTPRPPAPRARRRVTGGEG